MYNRNVRCKKSTVRNCTVVKMESKVGIEKGVDALGRIVIPSPPQRGGVCYLFLLYFSIASAISVAVPSSSSRNSFGLTRYAPLPRMMNCSSISEVTTRT